MEWIYSDKVKDHFQNPRNILQDEDSFAADGKGRVGSPACGDEIVMLIKVADELITDCKWQTYGCPSAIASTSILSEMVIGLHVDQAYIITPQQILAELGGLPKNKMHCSVIGDKALKLAIDDYYFRQGQASKIRTPQDRTVCECVGVKASEIEEAVLHGVTDFKEMQARLMFGLGCRECLPAAEELFKKYSTDYWS